MTLTQKRTLLLLAILGLLYFAAFFVPNNRGARNENMLRVFSGDEYVLYPNVEHMVTTPKDIHDFIWRIIIYGDYHYGYLYFFFSALAILPVKILYGEPFINQMQLSFLMMRQFISVLPMILAAGVMVFAQTRFRSIWRSAALFALILLVPGIVRQNMWWWHPDALAILCVALTLLFLALDNLRLGKYFFLAAITCGLSIAIKLLGFFFVFALAGYMLAAWLSRKQPLGRVTLRAAGFIGLMALVIVLSNPFLFYASQREKLIQIQSQKTVELSQGYAHDDPGYYQKGPIWWQETLDRWYGSGAFLLLLVGLVAIGCLRGESQQINRLILAWVVPYSLYLLYFVAVKPDHYWLPVMLPLFSGALNGITWPSTGKYRWLWIGLTVLLIIILGWQSVQFVRADLANYMNILGQEAAMGY